MKPFSKILAFLLAFFLLAGSVAQAQDHPKGWSDKAKGAAIGGGGGAILGGLLGGGKGALIGAGAGVVGGGLIGRNRDKKVHPARYNHYVNNPSKRVPVHHYAHR